jgi:hypothetical protein
MSTEHQGRSILFFFLKFCFFAPVCLVLWWLCLPYYGWLIGQVSGGILLHATGIPVSSMAIEPAGVLNTDTLLMFGLEGIQRRFPIGLLVTNVAPYLALVLATGGLAWRRRLKILGIGVAVLSLGHVIYIVLVFIFSERIAVSREIPTALAQLFLTIPFLLWIVLAYWDRLGGYFSEPAGPEKKV